MNSRDVIRNILERRQKQAKEGRSVWYHGTDIKNLKSILSKGLIPMPKEKRAWGSHSRQSNPRQISLESFGGTYVTRNLMSAVSSSKSNPKLLIIMELQPRTLFSDEDNFTNQLVFERHDRDMLALYYALKYDENDSGVQEEFEKYYTKKTEMLFDPEYGDIDPQRLKNTSFSKNLKSLLFAFWKAWIVRSVSLITDSWVVTGQSSIDDAMAIVHYFSKYKEFEPKPEKDEILMTDEEYRKYRKTVHSFYDKLKDQFISDIGGTELPDAEKAEQVFRDQQEKLIVALRDMVHNFNKVRGTKNDTFSGMLNHGTTYEPIKYSGKNHITHIVAYNYQTREMVVYYGSSPLPEVFVKDFNSSVGNLSEYSIVWK